MSIGLGGILDIEDEKIIIQSRMVQGLNHRRPLVPSLEREIWRLGTN